MDKEEKARYELISSRDKKRYEREMFLFKEKGGTKEMLQKIKAAAPKKCLSAYMIFVRETRHRIQSENEDMPALQIMKEVGREWQELSDEGRQAFQAKADMDKIRFRKEKNLFESKMRKLVSAEEFDKSVLDDLPTDNQSRGVLKKRLMNSNNDQLSNDRVTKRPKIAKDPDAPKRSLSTFIYFSQDARDQVKREMPTKNAAQVMEEVARRWAHMNEDLKDPYRQKAQEDKARYDRELEEYRQKKQQEKENTVKPEPESPAEAEKPREVSVEVMTDETPDYPSNDLNVKRIDYNRQLESLYDPPITPQTSCSSTDNSECGFSEMASALDIDDYFLHREVPEMKPLLSMKGGTFVLQENTFAMTTFQDEDLVLESVFEEARAESTPIFI